MQLLNSLIETSDLHTLPNSNGEHILLFLVSSGELLVAASISFRPLLVSHARLIWCELCSEKVQNKACGKTTVFGVCYKTTQKYNVH